MIQFFNNPKFQEFDSSGNPLNAGKVYFYLAGTNTPQNTYPTIADAIANTNANTNPVILDSRGEAAIVLKPGLVYKVVLKDSDSNTIWTLDNSNSVSNTIYDVNGNELLDFTTVASAVNYMKIGNAATGQDVTITAFGDDTNVGIDLIGKGTGAVKLGQTTSVGVWLLGDQPICDSSGNEYIKFSKAATAVNEFTITNAAAGNSVVLAATGGDTNIIATIAGKGTGALKLGQLTSTGIWLVGDQPLKDSAGLNYLAFSKAATAVNYLTLGNSATGVALGLTATGTDTDIGVTITGKASGRITLNNTATDGVVACLQNTIGRTFLKPTATTDRTITLPDASFTMLAGGASASDQETATSTTVGVTPAVQQRHPGHPKAWCQLTYSGGTPSATSSYNVSSITDTGTGVAGINLTTAFSSTNYAVLAQKQGGSSTNNPPSVTNKSVGSYTVSIGNDSQVPTDLPSDSAAFGDQ